MPPGAEAVQQAEIAAMQGQKIGQAYAQEMMQGIDQAQSQKSQSTLSGATKCRWKLAVMNWPIMSDKGRGPDARVCTGHGSAGHHDG